MPITLYSPKKLRSPICLLDVPSAWKGCELVIGDIINRFKIKTDKALEFGVEYGYSTVVLSNFFKQVIGVDTFDGDQHTLHKNIEGFYEGIKDFLAPYKNIQLEKSSYQDYIKTKYMNAPFDLIHVDIVHTYQDTFNCGDWAMENATMVIFHDTESFPDVRRAVLDLSEKYSVEFYNYPHFYGLGILCHKSLS